MEQEKIKAVKKWKTPMKTKDVESFLGFVNFYKRFIQNFNYTAKPLNKLKGKKEWEWKEEHQQAFDELKVSDMVHIGVEVCKMDLEMSRLVEQPWLQLMCCTICLLYGRNFR